MVRTDPGAGAGRFHQEQAESTVDPNDPGAPPDPELEDGQIVFRVQAWQKNAQAHGTHFDSGDLVERF